MRKWLIIKIGLIIAGIGMAVYQGALTSHTKPQITLNVLIIPVLFGVFGLQFVIGIQAFNKQSDEKWFKPSWVCNPLNFAQPLCFFHFGGWFMLLSTLPTVLFTYFQSAEFLYDSLMPFFLGVGILGGVKVSEQIFRFKFDNV
jgi:hypothetical protein